MKIDLQARVIFELRKEIQNKGASKYFFKVYQTNVSLLLPLPQKHMRN